MSFESANGGKVNPNINHADKGFRQNCQSCTVAFEARLRGYNVSARSKTNNQTAWDLSRNPNLAWLDPDTMKPPEFTRVDANDENEMLKLLFSTVKPGERYTLAFESTGFGGGHIINVYRPEKGEVKLYDAQRPEGYGLTQGRKAIREKLAFMRYDRGHKPALQRIDNMIINPNVADKILSEGE